jgi:hypothetical protein
MVRWCVDDETKKPWSREQTLTYRKAMTVDAERDKTITNWVSPSHGWHKKDFLIHRIWQFLSTITVVVVHNFKALGFFYARY